jgi:hypothetical protein
VPALRVLLRVALRGTAARYQLCAVKVAVKRRDATMAAPRVLRMREVAESASGAGVGWWGDNQREMVVSCEGATRKAGVDAGKQGRGEHTSLAKKLSRQACCSTDQRA